MKEKFALIAELLQTSEFTQEALNDLTIEQALIGLSSIFARKVPLYGSINCIEMLIISELDLKKIFIKYAELLHKHKINLTTMLDLNFLYKTADILDIDPGVAP